METFYIILVLYFALIFIHGAYMVGLEIGREELTPVEKEKREHPLMAITIDATGATDAIEIAMRSLKEFTAAMLSNSPYTNTSRCMHERITLLPTSINDDKIQYHSPFPPGSKFSFEYPFKFEAGGVIE